MARFPFDPPVRVEIAVFAGADTYDRIVAETGLTKQQVISAVSCLVRKGSLAYVDVDGMTGRRIVPADVSQPPDVDKGLAQLDKMAKSRFITLPLPEGITPEEAPIVWKMGLAAWQAVKAT